MLLALPVHGGEGSNTYGETCQRRTQDGSAYDNGCPFSARTFHCRRLFNTDERTSVDAIILPDMTTSVARFVGEKFHSP
jgi:hypothetical protein